MLLVSVPCNVIWCNTLRSCAPCDSGHRHKPSLQHRQQQQQLPTETANPFSTRARLFLPWSRCCLLHYLLLLCLLVLLLHLLPLWRRQWWCLLCHSPLTAAAACASTASHVPLQLCQPVRALDASLCAAAVAVAVWARTSPSLPMTIKDNKEHCTNQLLSISTQCTAATVVLGNTVWQQHRPLHTVASAHAPTIMASAAVQHGLTTFPGHKASEKIS